MILPFGSEDSASVAFWSNTRIELAAAVAVAAIAAIAAAWAAWPLIAAGLDRALLDAAQFHPLLLGRFGIYQAALLVLIGGCMIAYAAIWRVSAAETLASMFALAAGASLALLAARSRLQRRQRDRRGQSAGEDADLCRCQHGRRRERIEPRGDSPAAARRARFGAGALHFRAALLAASDRVSHLADRARHRLCLAARREAGRDAGAGAAAGRDRDRRARRAARTEIRIFHLHRSPDHPRRRDPARSLARSALSQMGLSDRHGAVRTAYRRRPGRADQIRLHAQRPGIDL